MWAYIVNPTHDNLTAGKRYRINKYRNSPRGSFLFHIKDDLFTPCIYAARGHHSGSDREWRIVLKPRIRRMGVVA